VALLALLFPSAAAAQTDFQLWSSVALKWAKSHRLSYQVEIEPKALLVLAEEDDPGWATVDVIPNIEYAVRPWVDFIGEVPTGFTAQTDDLDSFELSPRGGVRLHLFSREIPRAVDLRELPPKRKIVIRDLARVEWRNLFYNQDQPTSSTVRFRNRLEFLVPLNTDRLTDDGARYLLADWEWFIPLEDVAERYANKQRIRAGIGYRRDVRWRVEALYIWNRSRNTVDDGFTTSDHVVDVRMTRVLGGR
jgi:Protein of unknown function (DUF2490)